MKKKKPGEQPPADFKSNPFKALKGFAPSSSSADKKASPPRRKEEKSEDDSALFLRAVSGARKITEDEFPVVDAAVKEAKAGPIPATVDDDRLFSGPCRRSGPPSKDARPADDETHDSQRRSPSSRMKQLEARHDPHQR
jgi:hypothetical protein